MKAITTGFLVLSLGLSGCASGLSGGTVTGGNVAGKAPAQETYRKGEISPNVYLSTVIVRPDGCAPHGTACTMMGPGGVLLIVPLREEAPSWMYEMFAHEICHVVAKVKEIRPDPCHREDGGQIRANGGRKMGAVAPAQPLTRPTQEGSSSGHIRMPTDTLAIRVP